MAYSSEPSIQPDDTQPRQPTQALVPDPSWSAPLDMRGLIDPEGSAARPSRLSCVLGGLIVVASMIMCAFIVLLSAVAGYQDELKVIQTEESEALQATNAAQYELAMADIARQNFEFAYVRLGSIITSQPNYRDVEQQMSQLEVVLSYTPTLAATSTPTLTPTPTLTLTPEFTPTPTVNEVEVYFGRATSYYNFSRWEDTIAALDVVISLDPTYRRAEVDSMLFDAYNQQSRIYFRGTNPIDEAGPGGFPGNQLARGVLLHDLAYAMVAEGKPVGAASELDTYTSGFVSRFITARRYLDAGQASTALPILEALCSENCGWAYRGLSVEQLLSQARGS